MKILLPHCLVLACAVGSVLGSLGVTQITSGTDEFVRVKTEPSFNFYQMNIDTASGSKTTCTISSIQTVNLILAIRYGALPDAFGTAGTDYDCTANVNAATIGSNSETCEATAASDARAYIQVVADDTSTSNAENAMDIRCDTTAPSATDTTTGGGGECFSGDMTVRVQHQGTPVKMKDIKVGDWVQTNSRDKYQPIYAMAHVQENVAMEYLEIETEDTDKPLVISRDHLIFVDKGTPHPVAARNLAVGDSLLTTTATTIHSNATTTSTKITHIGTTYQLGKYAPLTPDGTLVVNGIVTSTYVSILGTDSMELQQRYPIMSWHTFIHVFYMAPIRMACHHTDWQGVCHQYLTVRDPTTGYAKFVAVGFQFAQWVHRQTMAMQLVLLVLTMMVLGPMALVEQTILATRGTTAAGVCAVGAVLLLMTTTRQQWKQRETQKRKTA
ncbi:Desert hedgehog protein [Seminavis robusta]|uniref:Desert hedgehog protein n=1 Tax=Seminavis robusta TaxID=568900 RepID=A0A9N8H1Y2_9STRA|nr:Desert hedgehog protein [Seminavis robusta]|eukprot:Sro52_g031050.1 Desert hedgehog protein (442) ;mRNA; r:87213-88656